MSHEVVFVGGGDGYRDAPITDGRVQVWSCNRMHLKWSELEERADQWFDLHKPSYLADEVPVQYEWLKQPNGPPVMMQEGYDWAPRSVEFPAEQIRRRFPRGDYHASSLDWIIAYALLLDTDVLRLFGVDFAGAGLPVSARPCAEYWIGQAEQRGTEVQIYGNSALCEVLTRAKLDQEYGYDHYEHLMDLTDE